MSTTNTPIETFDAAWQQLQDQPPAALQIKRHQAYQQFKQQGLPTSRTDAWRYTSLSQNLLAGFQPTELDNTITKSSFERYLLDVTAPSQLFFYNGWFVAADGLGSEIYFQNIAKIADDSEWQQQLQTELQPISSMQALNQSFCTDGCLLAIPDNLEILEPIYINHFIDTTDAALMAHPRSLIKVGANAKVTLIEHYHVLGKQRGLHNGSTTVELAEGAKLEHYILQSSTTESIQVLDSQVNLKNMAEYQGRLLATGGIINRVSQSVNLLGNGAQAHIYSLQKPIKAEVHDIFLNLNHQGKQTYSKTINRGTVDNKAKGALTGHIQVHPSAVDTQAHLDSKHLLLSPTAEADSRPQLEINQDAVQCSHGATIGELDKQALFYLQSRGIDKMDAKQLLIASFDAPVLEHIKVEAIQQFIGTMG